MSKTSGADPITREQVERAMLGKTVWDVADALGTAWTDKAPQWMRTYWCRTRTGGGLVPEPEDIAALTRWRDELVAAEPVRRVARWDADADHYVLTPPYTHTYAYVGITTKRETAIAWGYEIEGGPEPVAPKLSPCPDCGGPRTDMDEHDAWCDDCWGKRCQPAEDSPERLRSRREALGLSMSAAASLARINMDDVDALEGTCRRWPDCDRCGEMRPAYAAALSAEEARLAALASGRRIGKSINTAQQFSEEPHDWGDEPERPAPRFKVGDWVLVAQPHSPYYGHVYQVAEIRDGWHRKTVGSSQCSHWVDALEPASPPAPEVVDVPQPVVKRVSGVMVSGRDEDQYALWSNGESVIALTFVRNDSADSRESVSIALLRAMLEAIDAQQGGAS